MLTEKKPVPRWFIVTAALAVVWNLLGVAAFVMQISMTPEMIAELPEAQQALLESMPQWVLIAFAIAVFGCVLGALGLVLRKVWSLLFLWLSLFAVLAQQSYTFLMSDTLQVMGVQAAVMPALVTIIAVALVMIARNANTRHWLS
ncbi:MAG: hypothetical protein HRT76_12900 [Halieaceae bacterium]|nr:hypothetical protein [Halieaceae bacterium]